MASIDPYKQTNGTVSYRVEWREAGRKEKYTLHDQRAADAFCALVSAAGNRLPTRAQLDAFGLGWVLGETPVRDVIEAWCVGRLVAEYLEYKTALKGSKKISHTTTLKDYLAYARLHVYPHVFATLPIDRVDADQAELWQNELLSKPREKGRGLLSPQAVSKIRSGVVSPAFDWAVRPTSRCGSPLRPAANPFDDVETPERIVRAPEIVVTAEELGLFLAAAFGIDANWAQLLVMTLAGGFRFGEVTAVNVSAVDFDRGGVWTRQKYARGVLEPGTKSGTTPFKPLSPWLMEGILRPRCEGRSPDALVFVGPWGERWAYTTYRKRWEWLRVELASRGLAKHLTGHGLRHAFATLQRNGGVDPVLVSKTLGQRSIAITDHYTHLAPEGAAAIAGLMSGLLIDAGLPALLAA